MKVEDLSEEEIEELRLFYQYEMPGSNAYFTNKMLEHGIETVGSIDLRQSLRTDINSRQQVEKEIARKFKVILYQDMPEFHPGEDFPPAPEGQAYFPDWYNRVRDLASSLEYEQLVCSACPFSGGKEAFIANGGYRIPCNAFHGIMYSLRHPYQCYMVSYASWTVEQLYNNIEQLHGADALDKFKQKERELREATLVSASN